MTSNSATHHIIQDAQSKKYWTGKKWTCAVSEARCYFDAAAALKTANKLGQELAGDDKISYVAVHTITC